MSLSLRMAPMTRVREKSPARSATRAGRKFLVQREGFLLQEPARGFEPLTCRLQVGCAARLRHAGGHGPILRRVPGDVLVSRPAPAGQPSAVNWATTWMCPTMLSLSSARSSAGIQYSSTVRPPTWCTSYRSRNDFRTANLVT